MRALLSMTTALFLLSGQAFALDRTITCSDPGLMTEFNFVASGKFGTALIREMPYSEETLAAKLGAPLSNVIYEIEFELTDRCRDSQDAPLLISCATSEPLFRNLKLRNTRTGQVVTHTLDQVGSLELQTQATKSLFGQDSVNVSDRVIIDFVGYSAKFPFNKGGLTRTLEFDRRQCKVEL